MNDEYKEGFRLTFGDGSKAIHGGFIKDIPSLIITDMGIGKIGEIAVTPGFVPNGRELCAFTFTNIESVEAMLVELNRVRDHWLRREEPFTYPADVEAALISEAD